MATYSGSPLSQGNKNNILDILSASQAASLNEGSVMNPVGSSSAGASPGGWDGMSSANKMGAINAGMSTPGGIGDKLMSGGISAGLMGAGPVGWGVAGGGLVLSLIEAEQRKKAEEEAQRVAAENQKTENMKSQINKLMNMRLGV